MPILKKEREVVHAATEQLKDSSQLLLAVAGVAVVVAVVALVVAVSRK